MNGAIEVLEIRRLTADGNLKAFAKVRLGAVVINSCRVIQQPGQRAWVAMPQQKSGERWYPLVEITRRELMDQVKDAVLQAWTSGR
jgi:DNA-binding cell septation regulator SpoVG